MGDPFSRANRVIFPPGTDIDGFKIQCLLGQGGYGDVYMVSSRNPNFPNYIAMKTEYKGAPKHGLEGEVQILQDIHGEYYPKIFAIGETDEIRYAIMQAFGTSIGKIRLNNHGSLPQFMAIPIWLEMLKIIENLHDQGFVHCDIKPSNFLLQIHDDSPLCLVDFGLAHRFMDPINGLLPKPSRGHFVGTKKYASIYVHNREAYCRRDDLISWFYSLIEALKGHLPWGSYSYADQVKEAKENISIGKLCLLLPKKLIEIWNYINILQYEDRPDYVFIEEKLHEIMRTSHFRSLNWRKLADDNPNGVPLDLDEFDNSFINVGDSCQCCSVI